MSGLLADMLIESWGFYIDIDCYQILSYHRTFNKELLIQSRNELIIKKPVNLSRLTRLKLILIKINLYKYLYPILARARWI